MGNLYQLIQMLKASKNPQYAFNMMINNNPQMQGMLQGLQNSTNGASMEQAVRQLARQQGISDDEITQIYNSLR